MKKIIAIVAVGIILGFQSNSHAIHSNFAFGQTMFDDRFGHEVMEPAKRVVQEQIVNKGANKATTQYRMAKKEEKNTEKIEDFRQEALGRKTIEHWSHINMNCLMIANIEETKFNVQNAKAQIAQIRKDHPNATKDFIIEECTKQFAGNDVEKTQNAFDISYALFRENLTFPSFADKKTQNEFDQYRYNCKLTSDYDLNKRMHRFEDYKDKRNPMLLPGDLHSAFANARKEAEKELNPPSFIASFFRKK